MRQNKNFFLEKYKHTDSNTVQDKNKLQKLRRYVNWVHFAKIHQKITYKYKYNDKDSDNDKDKEAVTYKRPMQGLKVFCALCSTES